jgi:Cu+-exporting ATPase
MSLVAERVREPKGQTKVDALCYHCGTPCISDSIAINDKLFCCEGCKLVYEIINENNLCDYYKIQSHPGLSQIKTAQSDKFAYLDNDEIAGRLYQFTNGDLTIVTLYVPGIHCSSCMWLLEHLNRLDSGIHESRLNFSAKEVTIHFSRNKISLRRIVELLTTIGYEPYISLADSGARASKSYNKRRIYKLGIAGFCFGNIMMMSFPEYLSGTIGIGEQYTYLFRFLNLVLALPIFFYCATEFFVTAWKGLRQKMLNIDTPIALALIITFTRSIYEITTGAGAGYLDSMSGIVFFMLVGRSVQERTYRSLSFTRDYKSYFPIAVRVQTSSGLVSKKLQDLKEKDVVVLHHDEIIPADAMVISGNANIDYSFVTGEAEPVRVKQNELVYAGGRQVGEQLIVQVVKPVAASYLTSLWNHYAFKKNKTDDNDKGSVIHVLSKYFTIILLGLAGITALYWFYHDPSKIINSVSAMLIVACPCALLLTATFTNGNILRIFSNNGFYLRDATVIEQIGKIDHIVFDKTGTLTEGSNAHITSNGHQLTDREKDLVYAVVCNSKHPNSKALLAWLGHRKKVELTGWKEVAGRGLEAYTVDAHVLVGSRAFVGATANVGEDEKATLYVSVDGRVTAFHLNSLFRTHVEDIVPALCRKYRLSLLSGDNDKQLSIFRRLFGSESRLLFKQKPIDKLGYIEQLQGAGQCVMMIGDGLNDAGALQQSDVGVTLTDDVNNFTPACDAILDARNIESLPALVQMAKVSRIIIGLSFLVSILYNAAGLYFAMQGLLQPVAAAILMPCSTLSIVIITSGLGSLIAWRKGLRLTGA